MEIDICKDQSGVLINYAHIPIVFEVRQYLEVVPRELKVETQNINVAAWRFYEKQGY